MEIKSEPTGITLKPKEDAVVKTEGAAGIVLKPKQDVVSKSAAQIVREQHAK
jgi:replication factor A1